MQLNRRQAIGGAVTSAALAVLGSVAAVAAPRGTCTGGFVKDVVPEVKKLGPHTKKLMDVSKKMMHKMEVERQRSYRRVADILQQCSNHNHTISQQAQGELAEAMFPSFQKETLDKCGIRYHELWPGHYHDTTHRSTSIDLGSSVDMHLKYARDGRVDVFARCIQMMAENIVRKIEQYKTDDSFLCDIQLWNDPSMNKQGRLGFYSWVELCHPNVKKEPIVWKN